MADEIAKELADREGRAFDGKENLLSLWQELALNFSPDLADFTTESCLGEDYASDLYDSEPLRCARDLADARASMLRPDGQEYVRAETRDEKLNKRDDVAATLDHINARARVFLDDPNHGFSNAEKEADKWVAVFGGAVLTVESDIDRTGTRIPLVKNWHLRDCAWFDDMTGTRPDVMFRRDRASARHLKKKFPKADFPEAIKRALEKEPDKEFEFCHAMMPSDEYGWYKKPSRVNRKLPWASVYYTREDRCLLSERPSERFRYIVDRWAKLPGSQYPYSPAAMVSLPDARMMQVMAMVLQEASEKSLDPPMLARDGAFKSDIDMRASGVTWYDSSRYDERTGPLIQPLIPEMRNIPIGVDLINRTILALRDNWYLSKLRLPMQAKTAFETQALLEQFIRENLPLFGPWQAGLSMTLEEVYGVLFDMGWFDTPQFPMREWPEELSDGELVFTFKNPLRDVIERNRVNQGTQVFGAAAALEKLKPGISQHIWDFAKIGQDFTRGTGAPAEWLSPEEDAKQGIQNTNQAGDVLGALNMAQQAADVVHTGSQAASELQGMNQPSADGSFAYGPS